MFKELIVPLAVIAVLCSMLLPLPPLVIDFLLVGNLILALIMLLSALYITEPLKLSALPTILLLATLYRLALNISTTRLILGGGDVGRMIEAFGEVVIRGEVIVGLVVFLVITLVQFIVIAKGSERVAEVSARFTLDALPGKQMSIDADVRAGLIDFQTARDKRQDLQTESRFYGALDGAMKFIKGDAIAGIAITAINILGGFSIAVLVNGFELKQALSQYTLFTVGDGLLSQIPALLNALAAGMIVTRVVRAEKSSLSSELVEQLGQLSLVKVIVGSLAFVLAFVPGMPALPFILLGSLLLFSAMLSRSKKASSLTTTVKAFKPVIPALIGLSLPKEKWHEWQSTNLLGECLKQFQKQCYENFGLILQPPQVDFTLDATNRAEIRHRGVCVSEFSLRGQSEADLKQILDQLFGLVSKTPEEFIDDILTRRTLDYLDEEAPELVSAVVPGAVSVTQLTTLLKALCSEQISIINFDLILQAVAEKAAKVNSDRELLMESRIALRRLITAKYAKDNKLAATTLDPVLDMALSAAEQGKSELDSRQIDIITEQAEEHSSKADCLLVLKWSRQLISELFKIKKIKVTVLAHEEILEDIEINNIATIIFREADESLQFETINKLAA